jgi:hypothetical protein
VSALIQLGLVSCQLVRNVKISYCLVGYTHEVIATMIGTVICNLRSRSIPSLSVYASAVKASRQPYPKKMLRYWLSKYAIQGIPDYDAMFIAQNFDVGHAAGIMSCQEIRLSMNDDDFAVRVHYRPDWRVGTRYQYCRRLHWLTRGNIFLCRRT